MTAVLIPMQFQTRVSKFLQTSTFSQDMTVLRISSTQSSEICCSELVNGMRSLKSSLMEFQSIWILCSKATPNAIVNCPTNSQKKLDWIWILSTAVTVTKYVECCFLLLEGLRMTKIKILKQHRRFLSSFALNCAKSSIYYIS